jgi:hypothetical protein
MSNDQSRLYLEWRLLINQWQVTQDGWRDPISQRFEKEFWDRYLQVVPTVLQSIASLKVVLDQASRDIP